MQNNVASWDKSFLRAGSVRLSIVCYTFKYRFVRFQELIFLIQLQFLLTDVQSLNISQPCTPNQHSDWCLCDVNIVVVHVMHVLSSLHPLHVYTVCIAALALDHFVCT